MKTHETFASLAARAVAVAIIATVVLAMSGVARADVVNASWHKNNRGTLKITNPTEIGGVLLQPGTYELKVKKSATGAVIEFAQWTDDPYAAEGLPVYTREVVASIKALPQVASSPAPRTMLLLASAEAGPVIGLQIRGQAVDYVF